MLRGKKTPKEAEMATLKKNSNEEFIKEIFMALLDKWDVKDKASAKNLAKHAVEIAEGYAEVLKPAPLVAKH